MKKLSYILIAFITLSACKKDEKVNPLLETTWELQTAKWKYTEENDDKYNEFYNIADTDIKRYVQFKSDNSATEYFKYDNETLTYPFRSTFTLNGNSIISNVFDWESTITYSIDGDTLTIIIKDENYQEILVYKKSNVDLSNAVESRPV